MMGNLVATPSGLGRVLGPSRRVETDDGPMWLRMAYDPDLRRDVVLASTDGPFVAVQVGHEIFPFAADDLQRVNPAVLGPLERIWLAVFWEAT